MRLLSKIVLNHQTKKVKLSTQGPLNLVHPEKNSNSFLTNEGRVIYCGPCPGSGKSVGSGLEHGLGR